MGIPEKDIFFRERACETSKWKDKILPAPHSTSKATWWLAKNLAQVTHNTTFSHHAVISTTKIHSHPMSTSPGRAAWRDNFGYQTWEESLKYQQGRNQVTTTTASAEIRKTGMVSETTRQELVMSQELCTSHRRKGTQHCSGKQHYSLVKGHKAVASFALVSEGLNPGIGFEMF